MTVRKILCDTTVWVDYFAGREDRRTNRLEAAMVGGSLILGDLVAVEVLQGVRSPKLLQTAEAMFEAVPQRSLCGFHIARKAASNYRYLRRSGITIRGVIDVIIATWCIENEVALLHNDRDFLPMEEHLGLIAA
ncbi:MAG: PIN domain nuclease [Pseudomonadota bacterium]